MARPRVTVLGSLNTDISVPVPHLPGPGETVLAAAAASIGTGGKGANQAVAAARLGASTRMVGCCGDDEFGGRLRAALVAEGIDVTGLRSVPGATSGLALITVDPAGENVIAVAPGANGLAGEEEVAAAFSAPCDVLVLSAEIPVAVLAAALRRANAGGWKGEGGAVARGGERRAWKGGGGAAAQSERRVRTVLNLAPVPEGAGRLLAGQPDWLVVNAHEAGILLGAEAADAAQAQAMAVRLAAGETGPGAGAASLADPGSGAGPGGRHAVITLGGAGAVLAGPAVAAAIDGFSVPAVDTVGAGDAFVGALAVALASGLDPAEAVRAACAAGATATTRRGAQDGLPRPAGVLAATGFRWPEISD
jgi:ribokinase